MGLELLPILLVFLVLAIWAKNNIKKRIRQAARSGAGEKSGLFRRQDSRGYHDDPFEEKWEMYVKYDPRVQAAIETVKPAGPAGLAELKAAFKGVSDDRSRIAELAAKIVRDRRSERAAPRPPRGRAATPAPKAARAPEAKAGQRPRPTTAKKQESAPTPNRPSKPSAAPRSASAPRPKEPKAAVRDPPANSG